MTEMKTLTCLVCGQDFEHPKQRGRPPKTCPEHRGVKSVASVSDTNDAVLRPENTVAHPRTNGCSISTPARPFAFPVKSRGTVMLCGFCGGAPRTRDGSASHLRCPGPGFCACGQAGHVLSPDMRIYQSKHNYMSIDDCIARDPGLEGASK